MLFPIKTYIRFIQSKKIFIGLLLFFLKTPFHSFCQPNSYQYFLDDVDLVLQDVLTNEYDELAIFLMDFENASYLIPFDGTPGIKSGVEFKHPSMSPLLLADSDYKEDVFLMDIFVLPPVTDNNSHVISYYNVVSGNIWSKRMNGNSVSSNQCKLYENGDVLYLSGTTKYNTTYMDIGILEIFKIGGDGNLISKKGFLFEENSLEDFAGIVITEVVFSEGDGFYLLGVFKSNDSSVDCVPFVGKFDSDFNPIILKKIDGNGFNQVVITEDGPLLLNYSSNHLGGINVSLFIKNENAILLQLDENLDFIWGKEYFGDGFRHAASGIDQLPSGALLMSHTTVGSYPVILTNMDNQGNIISQKGFPNFAPQIDILSDGAFLISSIYNFDEEGNTHRQPVIAKTDEFGNINGCYSTPTCIQSNEIEIGLTPFQVEEYTINDPEDYSVEITPVTFSFSEGCDFPPPPFPDFTFPDTLCLGDSATTTDIYNRLANAHEWRLTGPGVDSVVTDSFDFGYRFHTAGEYLLQHTIWVLGCAYPFEKTVTVLPELEVHIDPNILCPDEPQQLTVATNRPATSYLWNTGVASATLSVASSGTYSVQASDGHCITADTAEVSVVAELLAGQEVINFIESPYDCSRLLPYHLQIESFFTDTFFVNNDIVMDGSYLLEAYGDYLFITEIGGCYFSKNFTLKEGNCEASVYLPNIISPNGDGINDEFFPQGKDFEIVSLKIYDRWGGLRYDGNGNGAVWSPGGSVPQGAYLYHLVYMNLLTGMEETVSGDLVVVR